MVVAVTNKFVVHKSVIKSPVVKSSVRNRPDRLSAFVAAALALPGIADTQAADGGYRSDDPIVSYNRASYQESSARMDVHTDQVTVTFPIKTNFEGRLNIIKDVTSGASPVVNLLDANHQPKQILQSGASIRDERNVHDVGLGYYGEKYYLALGIGQSKEDDYESDYQSLDLRFQFNDKLTTLFLGGSYNSDEVWNSVSKDSLFDEPQTFNKRRKQDLMVGIGQVLNSKTVIQFNLTHSHAYGHLSDPYKKVFVVDESQQDTIGTLNVASGLNFLIDTGLVRFLNESGLSFQINNSGLVNTQQFAANLFGLVSDSRPDERDQWSGFFRASHYLEGSDSALHMDYRYVYDDWDANSHTIEFKWNKALGDDWQISPGVRYYTQSSAKFYDLFFATVPESGYLTSDYRLAGFGAVSAKIEVMKVIRDAVFVRVNYEVYNRKHDFAFIGVNKGESNGDELDDYMSRMLSISIDGTF